MGCFSVLSPFKQQKAERKEEKEVLSYQNVPHHNASASACCCACEPLPGYEEVNQKMQWDLISDEAKKTAQSSKEMGDTIASTIKSIDGELRKLSLSMWSKPELGWQEKETHDLFVSYLKGKDGWKITPHAYGFETAFRAEFVHRPEGCKIKSEDLPTIGFQSELDALPGIGHACGHNLIAIAGVGASLALANALQKHDVPGKVVLLGTPAEEMQGGKIRLLAKGAYEGMDTCLMVHPASLDSVGIMLAKSDLLVRYTGHGAHAGAAPWEGVNAQDAAVLSYVNISALRQQIKPDYRVHGIIQGDKSWASNVIPAACDLMFNIRAPTANECDTLVKRVHNCFEAAALATGCKADIRISDPYKDVANNDSLADSFRAIADQRFSKKVTKQAFFASTDFGDVTYALPALHAQYSIPLKNPATDKNHTPGFADAAKTQEAHDLTLEAAITIAIIGAKVASDGAYRKQIWDQWKKWKGGRM